MRLLNEIETAKVNGYGISVTGTCYCYAGWIKIEAPQADTMSVCQEHRCDFFTSPPTTMWEGWMFEEETKGYRGWC